MNEQCLFCNIAAGSIPSTKVFEDDRIVAFHDIHPVAPVHILLIPKKHIPSVAVLDQHDQELVGALVWRAKHIAEAQGIAERGYRLVFNIRKHAGQVVDHIHLHLIGGKQLERMA